MTRPLTILFLHFRTDDLTRQRHARLQRLNPGVPIVGLTYSEPDVLPGTFNAARVPGWEGRSGWHNADLSIYAWFRDGRSAETTAERYAIVEYDMAFRVPLADFYREVWDEEVACAQLYRGGPHSEWHWFQKQTRLLPPELRKHAAGVMPLAGTFASHRAVAGACAQEIPMDIFCEFRLGTLFCAAGVDIVELPFAKKRNNLWKEEFLQMDRVTDVYHPVKFLLDFERD